MGPERGTCHKLGFIFLILMIALLRMAHILLYPIIDPTQALPIITRASTFIITNSEAWIFNTVIIFSQFNMVRVRSTIPLLQNRRRLHHIVPASVLHLHWHLLWKLILLFCPLTRVLDLLHLPLAQRRRPIHWRDFSRSWPTNFQAHLPQRIQTTTVTLRSRTTDADSMATRHV